MKKIIFAILITTTTASAEPVTCNDPEFAASPLCNLNFSVPEPTVAPAPPIIFNNIQPLSPPREIPLAEEVTLCDGAPCVNEAPPVVEIQPAPTIAAQEVKDLYGGTLPPLAPFSTELLQQWHDDAASEGKTKAYDHYLACWHTRSIEQVNCGK